MRPGQASRAIAAAVVLLAAASCTTSRVRQPVANTTGATTGVIGSGAYAEGPLPSLNPSAHLPFPPPLVRSVAGLTRIRAAYLERVIVAPDDKTLVIYFTANSSDGPCGMFSHTNVRSGEHSVSVALFLGDRPGAICGNEIVTLQTVVELRTPLSNRRLFDRNHPAMPLLVEKGY